MVWQNIIMYGVVEDLFFKFLIVFLIPFSLISQEKDSSNHFKGFGLKTNAFITFPYENNEKVNELSDNEITEKTNIHGCNVILSYNLSPYFGLGLGTGYEVVTQPNIQYYPLFLNLSGNSSDASESYTANANFGIHKGDLDKNGFIFRSSLGYKISISDVLKANFEILYSFQNIYKSFPNSVRIDNYYNIESIGISVGFEIK